MTPNNTQAHKVSTQIVWLVAIMMEVVGMTIVVKEVVA